MTKEWWDRLVHMMDLAEESLEFIECEITGKNYRCTTTAELEGRQCERCSLREELRNTLASFRGGRSAKTPEKQSTPTEVTSQVLHGWIIGIGFADDTQTVREFEFTEKEPANPERWDKATLIWGSHI